MNLRPVRTIEFPSQDSRRSRSARRAWASIGAWVLGVVLLGGPTVAVAAAATLTGVAWEPVEREGGRGLTLRFQGDAPELEVEQTGNGLHVTLPGIEAADVPAPDRVQIEQRPDGVHLRFEERRLAFRAIRWAEGRVTILLSEANPSRVAEGDAYRLGVGDVVAVSVYKNDDLSGEFTVLSDGMIVLHLVGPVRASGRTVAELAAELKQVLERDLLVNPQVSVSVRSYQSQFIYVTGAVAQARRVALRPGMQLRDALSEAGVALAPGQEVSLSRTGAGGDTLVLKAEDLDSGEAPLPRDGDVLTVQETKNFVFINGEVQQPGRIPHSPGMTLLQALSQARGLTDWAQKKGVRIRRSATGRLIELRVDLRKVEDGGASDPRLEPGDVILVRRRAL